jgi:EPS-associated MarR family transcriptional regulator
LKVLRLLELNPHINQRDLSKILGISLGKTNYCIKALLDKGLIKMQNFRNNQNKLAYIYFLTPAGVEEKARITVYFLKSKVQEFERLRVEIDELYNETTQLGLKNSSLQQKIK